MLYIVLLLVLAALGLLVTALITANSLWAWVSIILSVLAGLFLIADFVRRRRKRKRAAKVGDTLGAAEPAAEERAEASEEEPAEDTDTGETVVAEEPATADSTALLPATGEVAEAEEKTEPEPVGDPAEEESAPADVEVVSALELEVVVVDEYPRYHVPDCGWLADRDTIPIAVKEARELGFTPCARCTPDAKLAAEHRAVTKS
ncbi:hypothetical protein [Amycolatopsis sp.]|uniref:hypothetical protein n=1 Tax=Amycolatopsis sp. TaxID=37632 RepID=UPI002BC09893|nr:hypothetical protein [Amycolatopsis sp.]HVV10372.1 hypothetical protein [Amycolatopsis sp.]